MQEIPKAELDCRWHCVQWQMWIESGSGVGQVKATLAHWQRISIVD